jgi:hypothetical protein
MAAIPGTVNALIESASRRGNIPDAQMTYLTADFLAMIQEELMAYALPVLHARREDYYLEELTFYLDNPDTYIGHTASAQVKHPAWRLPDYAMAGTVRDVQAVSPGGSFYNLGRVEVDDVPNMNSQAWYFYGNYLVYQQNTIASTAPPVAIRCVVHSKPNTLIVTDEGNTTLVLPREISIINTLDPAAIPPTYYVSFRGRYSPFIGGYGQKTDIISGQTGEVLARNVQFVATMGMNEGTLTFENAPSPSSDVAGTTVAQFKQGDWLSATGTTPIIPLPTEMHALLAQRVVVKFLEAQGDAAQLEQSRQSLAEMALQIPLLIQPRAEGKPKKLVSRLGLWRRWRW